MAKLTTTIFFLLLSLSINGQVLSRGYLTRWVRLCDSTAQVNLVKAYIIDNQYFDLSVDTFSFHDRLSSIKVDKVHSIYYSKVKQDEYVPGTGFIAVRTIRQKSLENAKGWLTGAKKVFQDTYTSFSQHILTDSKDPVLIIDNKSIHHTLVREALDKIDPQDIYDISVNNFFPVPSTLYGQNAKNGLVQIWTKKNFKK